MSPMVLGNFSLAFGGLGLCTAPLSFIMVKAQQGFYEQMGYSLAYFQTMFALGVVFSLWLAVTGVGLVRYRRWGRTSFLVYAVATIVWTVVYILYSVVHLLGQPGLDPAMRQGGLIGAAFSLGGLIFPVLGLIFLNFREVKAAFDGRK